MSDDAICEACSQPIDDGGDAQVCEHCGMDGLGNCCIGTADHDCEAQDAGNEGP